MRIKINQIDFDVTPVAAQLRTALLGDALISQAILRDVWSWDGETQKGMPLTNLVQNGVAVLPNGLSFFVPRVTSEGAVVKNEKPSTVMAKRFIEAVGAKELREVMNGINRIVALPQKALPLDAFAPLNALASYRLRMFTDYAVLQLSNAARNLTGYVYLPAQVGFHAEIVKIIDEAAFAAKTVDLAQLRPGFIVPARTEAALGMRRAAVAKQFEELQAELDAAGGAEQASPLQKTRAVRLSQEWNVLAPKAPAAANQASARA